MSLPVDSRQRRIADLRASLRGRDLVWFGTRGTDAAPLLDFPEFSAIFAQVAPLGAVSLRTEHCLESITRRRVDLDAYDVDQDASDAVGELRARLVEQLRSPSVVVPYRPSRLLSSACFYAAETVAYLGQFAEAQTAFEHKPWVESELRRLGVPVVDWSYVAPSDTSRIAEALPSGPVVLRRSRSAGGTGFALVRTDDDLAAAIDEMGEEEVLGVARFLSPHLPLNVGACVFRDGVTSVHGMSFQLVGLPECTTRSFGYCGNDFGAVRDLDPHTIDHAERAVVMTGQWLASRGYRGAFGVDMVVHGDDVRVVEVNPRFQGSTGLASTLARGAGMTDIVLEHMAAHAGLYPLSAPPLREIVASQAGGAQMLCHNRLNDPVTWNDVAHASTAAAMAPQPGVSVDPGAVICRLLYDDVITSDGFSVTEAARAQVNRVVECSVTASAAMVP